MTRKLSDGHLDDAIRRYIAGERLDALGVSATTLYRVMKQRGLSTDRSRRDVPVEAVVSAYQDGASVLELSRRFGVSRATIASRLIVGLACGVLMHQFVTDAFKPRPYRQPWWRR